MKKGFTLIELIVVIAIIAVLAAIIAPNAFRAIEKAKMSKLIGDTKSYKTAILSLYADTGRWPGHGGTTPNRSIPFSDWTQLPQALQDGGYLYPHNLLENEQNWPGWDGPYIEQVDGKHPWGGIYSLQWWPSEFGDYFFANIGGMCYPGHPTDPVYTCGIPAKVAEKIDMAFDNNNLTYKSGLFFKWSIAAQNTYMWALAPLN